MGYPRDPWMTAVDSLWSEVKRRCQEAASAAKRLRIQELSAEMALAQQEFEDLQSRLGDVTGRVESLRAGHARCYEDIAALQRMIEDASKRLAERQAASTALAGIVAEAEAEEATLEQGLPR
ncbi:hypothetical protein Taro_017848 [Colocasia esculenta]|uniref:Uncharacterized protein n=1 Tax=Colocasia esculenta TaxID=4460 RepID=A0A843UPS6_COLES|nr:hypothetical protein [Colocasia esculenta]